eukprot:GFUD01011614.1.p1 GENE.GFUD01011614.1~~GFUD01011614.1.p1  ORF type:complete len:1750 (+),score=541.73 GFUD01011614.1:94-5343(+)
MEGGRLSGLESQQDGTQFEDALRRLNALEKKLAVQVQEDICELRNKWVQPRVDRVTNNTFKLYQVRENLKQSKLLYVEEDQVMGEFSKVKQILITNSMDDETFEAAKETCMVLGGKLGDVRHKQLMCYSDSRDLETAINKDIMTLRFENQDFEDLDLNHVRCNTPLRELSPTPLDRHRSREPSPFRMPPIKICTGTTTPGGTLPPDPHAYFSRPGSSQSMYGGRGGVDKDIDAFRAAMEAKQAQDDSPPKNRKQSSSFPTMITNYRPDNVVVRSASGQILTKPGESDAGPVFVSERPSSAMSDMSINIHDFGHTSRPGSRLDLLGDDVSGIIDPFAPAPDHVIDYTDHADTELDLEQEQALKKEEEAEIRRRSAEQVMLIQREAQEKFQENEKIRLVQEAADKKADEEMKKEKLRLQRELEMKEREEKRQADEQKIKDMAEKRKKDAELKKEKELKEQEEQKQKKLEVKQEKMRKAEETKLKKEEEEKKKEEAKQAKLEEKQSKIRKAEETKLKKEEEERKKEEIEQIKLEEKQEEIRRADEEKFKKMEEEKKIEEVKKAELEEKRNKMESEREQIKLEEEIRIKQEMDKDYAEMKNLSVKDPMDATDADDEGETTKEKPRSKSRSLSKGRTSGKGEAMEDVKDNLSSVQEVKVTPSETPKLSKPKRRTTSKDKSVGSEDEKGILKEETKVPSEIPKSVESKTGSRRTSQTGSPISILKGGKRSRDASKDRAADDIGTDESLISKPLTRTGSLKKSSSFNKRGTLAEKKKISFDEDVDVDKFVTEAEAIGTAKDIFAAIADTTLEAGTNILKQRSRDPSRERPGSRGSGSSFPQAEPAEWYPPEGSEFDNEDELMIILDTDQPLLDKDRSESKERAGSRGSQGSGSSAVSKPGVPELEIVDLPPSIKQMIDGMKGLQEELLEKEDFGIMLKPESPRPASTGFSRLDEFERKLAEMEHELENETKIFQYDEIDQSNQETFKYQEEPIYATIAPKKDRQTGRSQQMTDDGFFINRDEELLSFDQSYEPEEDVGSEYSRNKKVSFAESDERFEFERQKKDTGLRSFTKFFTLGPPKPMKSVPGKEIKQEPVEQETKQLEVSPIPPKRSVSKDRSQNLNNEATPQSFLTAMTGGLIDPSKNETGSIFGSFLRGRKSSRSGSRQGSRQSSGDRSSQELWSDDEGRPSSRGSVDPYDGTSDLISDTSLVNKLKKLKKKKPRQIQPKDFDELFARGMALSAQQESEITRDPMSRRSRKAQTLSITVTTPREDIERVDENGTRFTPFEVYSNDKAFQKSQKEVGIGYAEKVMSYLDDQAQTPILNMTNGETEGSHVSRGRKKHRQKAEKQAPIEKETESRSLSGNARSKSAEERKRSREYTKPEDIKLSPVPKRDLFTGEILSGSPQALMYTGKDPQYAKQAMPSVSYDPYNVKQEGGSVRQQYQHTQGMAPSPGKSFLDAVTGQEVFGASIEGENPEINAKLAASELLNKNNMNMNQQPLNTTAMNTNYDPSAMMAVQPQKIQVIPPPTREEPADKGIPAQLIPDKLMANEEFYEQLRSGMKSIEAYEHTQEDPETYQKYSHHLGRAEFGTLKQRTSTRPSAVASRDPSGDRLNQQRQQKAGLSRDPSGDRLTVGTKISRQSSREQIRSDSRFSNYSGGLPDLETDENIGLASGLDSHVGVQRTVSLLVSGVDMDRPVRTDIGQTDMKARREEVLKEIAQHKQEIRDAKAWIQNGLMTVIGFGVMAYLQTLETVGQ